MAEYNVTMKRHNGTIWEEIYPKTTAANIISGTLDAARIPNLATSKITSGTFAAARIPELDASKITTGTLGVDRIPNLGTAKITSGVFADARIPSLATSKITSGTFDVARIPDLDASKITGTLADARIPGLATSKITSGTFVDARIPSLSASKINSGTFDVARIPDLDASKITSGQIDVGRLPAVALTNVVTNTTMTAFQAIYEAGNMQEGDILILTTDKKTYIHNGGTAGTAADFTLMQTPTDVVTSVAGKIGVVTLVKGDVGLGNVANVDTTNPANITQNATYRFVSDTEKTTWNNKVTTVAGRTGAVTLVKGDVGLGNVQNKDTTNPANITQTATHRFVSDADITVWNNKVSTLSDLGINVTASQINSLQNKITLIQESLLEGLPTDEGFIAFTY